MNRRMADATLIMLIFAAVGGIFIAGPIIISRCMAATERKAIEAAKA